MKDQIMSSVAVETRMSNPLDVEKEEQLDKLGDLVEQMDNAKISTVETIEAPVKHPLQNAWTLWFYKNDKSRSWDENQKAIITVDTVEDFWSLYNHIEVASKLPSGSDYSLFKEGIFPDWEDKRNQNGGRWMISLDKRQRSRLDDYWLEILFFLIGEHADQHAHQVNGAVVNVRSKGDKLGVWLADSSQPDSILRIGKMLKERLGIDPSEKIGFNVHADEKSAKSSQLKKQKMYV